MKQTALFTSDDGTFVEEWDLWHEWVQFGCYHCDARLIVSASELPRISEGSWAHLRAHQCLLPLRPHKGTGQVYTCDEVFNQIRNEIRGPDRTSRCDP